MAQAYAVTAPDTPAGSNVVLSGNGALMVEKGTLTISSYVTGGEVLDLVGDRPNQFASVDLILFCGPAGRDFFWDPATKKVLAFTTAATEVANATNIGAVQFVAFGRSKS